MKSFMHANSATMPPTLTRDAIRIYRATLSGQPVEIMGGHYLAQDLRLVAERIDCDGAVIALLRAGALGCRVVDRGDYVEAAVHIARPDLTHLATVDAEAANRVAQRVASGMTLEDAVARTLAQCETPVLSGHALDKIEGAQAAAERRLDRRPTDARDVDPLAPEAPEMAEIAAALADARARRAKAAS